MGNFWPINQIFVAPKRNYENLLLAFHFFIEICFGNHFSTWSPSVHSQCSLSLKSNQPANWRSGSRVFLSNQGSLKVKAWESSITYPSMIRDHTLQILGVEKQANKASVKSLLNSPRCDLEPRGRIPWALLVILTITVGSLDHWTPSFLVPRPYNVVTSLYSLTESARQNPWWEFSSMLTLEFAFELNIHFRVVKSYTYWPKMGIFRCMSRDVWNLCLWPLCCPVLQHLPWMSFHRASSTC
jgi:hypothetical protein